MDDIKLTFVVHDMASLYGILQLDLRIADLRANGSSVIGF